MPAASPTAWLPATANLSRAEISLERMGAPIYIGPLRYISGGSGGMPILAWKTGERLILNCKATSLPCSTPAQPHVQTCQCGRPPSSVSCTPCCLVLCIALAREFCGTSVVVNSVVYTNKAGSLVGIEPTTVLFGFGEDIERRSTALETIKQNDVAFAVATAVKSLPIGGQGSAVQQKFDNLKRKLCGGREDPHRAYNRRHHS